MSKRVYDLFFSGIGLVLLAPLLLIIAFAIKLGDGGPVFFRQTRVGRGGRLFLIYKFRTMVAGTEAAGPSITRSGDSRVTRVGRILRRNKLDELPQLWNVIKGEMSLVGPRPEVPRYVAGYTEEQRRVLELVPGITDPGTLEFRNEEELLREAGDIESFYVNYCVPRKIELNLRYAEQAGFWEDTKIIFHTILPPKLFPAGRLRRTHACSRNRS